MSERSHPGDRVPTSDDPLGRFAPSSVTPIVGAAPAPPVRVASPYGYPWPAPPAYLPPPEYYLSLAPVAPVDSAVVPALASPALTSGNTAGPTVASYAGMAPAGSRSSTAAVHKRRGTKLLLPLGSALVSFALYTLYGGWQFGLGLVLLLLVHEMGHFVVIRAKGLPAALPVFIPFLGAYVAMQRLPNTVRDEAEIALAGPLAGAIGGGVCLLLAQYAIGGDVQTLLFLAYFSFFINLLNLLPVAPLDGGHIVGAISRWLWPMGLALLAAAYFYTYSLLLLVLGVLFFSQTVALFAMARRQAYYAVSLGTRLYISALYFGLAIGLGLALYVTQSALPLQLLFGR